MSVLVRGPAAVELLGAAVHPLTLPAAVALLEEAIARRQPTTVVSLNGALLMRLRRDAVVRRAVRGAALVIPDGIAVLLAARILGLPVRRRLAGVDLAEALCAAVARGRGRIFLLGAAPGVAEAAAGRLQRRFPGLQIAGTAHGYFLAEAEAQLLAAIRESRPDVLLVAFGAPRQELWLARNGAALGIPVMMGVGGTLDVLAGRARRAPRWLQAAGLEWLYRLWREPWRWGVVKTIPPLFVIALRERLRRRRNPPTHEGRNPPTHEGRNPPTHEGRNPPTHEGRNPPKG
jgi:N-acetylglucosaminyldiphosphoundecaprenol N-acetyl-beta-D-mannosaminyltransferase